MGKLAERKVALVQRILETRDEALLDSLDALVSGGTFQLSKAELDELDAIMERHRSGDGRSAEWPEVRKRVEQAARTKRRA
ncbi:MAG: hypothetical protein RBT71_05245 [Flavobacteriales bacterium]|jgi:hypothetical protein|nr:hypothetical protein [Flavobacteriales bacterium]